LERTSASGFKRVDLGLKPNRCSRARPKSTRKRLDLGSQGVGSGSDPDSDLVQLESFLAAVSGVDLGLSSSGIFVDR
jgi:hypothetical protein